MLYENLQNLILNKVDDYDTLLSMLFTNKKCHQIALQKLEEHYFRYPFRLVLISLVCTFCYQHSDKIACYYVNGTESTTKIGWVTCPNCCKYINLCKYIYNLIVSQAVLDDKITSGSLYLPVKSKYWLCHKLIIPRTDGSKSMGKLLDKYMVCEDGKWFVKTYFTKEDTPYSKNCPIDKIMEYNPDLIDIKEFNTLNETSRKAICKIID